MDYWSTDVADPRMAQVDIDTWRINADVPAYKRRSAEVIALKELDKLNQKLIRWVERKIHDIFQGQGV